MARYRVAVYSGPNHQPQGTLTLIAGLLGQTGLDGFKIDRSRENAGTISVEVATVRDGVVQGIARLDGVQTVIALGRR